MPFLIRRKAITPSTRHVIKFCKEHLWKNGKLSMLTSVSKGLRQTGGRNSSGKITVRHQGNGVKHRYFSVYNYPLSSVYAVVRFEYLAKRKSYGMLVYSKSGLYQYIVKIKGVLVGDTFDQEINEIKPGRVMFLKNVPFGFIISNIEKIALTQGTFLR